MKSTEKIYCYIKPIKEVAPHIGAFVTLPELNRIREIGYERRAIRNALATQNGATVNEASV